MNIRVRSGDTLWYYSQLFMIPIQLIIDSNRNVDSNSLQVGQKVKIPGFATINYTIKPADTFWKIARERNLSIDAILLLNQDLNPNQLQVGRDIHVPRRIITPFVQRGTQYDSSLLFRDIGELREAYPFIGVDTIGESVLGKSLYEIKLGRGSKKVHINGSFHANEWITSPIIMTLLNSYLLSLTNSSPIRGLNMLNLYNQVELSIVPMVNPDGVDLVLNGPSEGVREKVININEGSTDFTGWKANINGVDLNNQYPAKWEIEKKRKEPKSPAPRDYPGDAPLTEPEAIAMAELAMKEGFTRALAFHTQGEEFYWGYEGLEPPESGVIAAEFERVSGYQAIQNIDSHAGFKDWFIQEFRRPAFTLELGRGINPLPLSQFDQIYEKVLGIFLASLYM